MFSRAILHLDLDAFFASVEVLRNSALRGKPLIVGGHGGRGVVASCSYEARRFGIHAAMPVKMALRLCPDAIVLRGDYEAYEKHSQLVTEVIESEAPLFEKASIDEFYLDLSGMDRYIGCWKWSQELRQKLLRETGLPISQSLSVNKLVSKIGAGEAKPNGALLVEAGSEKAFIHPLPVAKLPSVGQATHRQLSLLGVRTIQTLSEIPRGLLHRAFGKNGLDMWEKAQAIDDSPVTPYRDAQSLSAERTLESDTTNMQRLHDLLRHLVSRLAFDLRNQGKLTACLTVKIRYADFNTFTRQKRIAPTAQDRILQQYARELFDQIYERRQFVRLIGVRLSRLAPGYTQLDLFDDTPAEVRLLQEMDHIRQRFGRDAVR